MPKIPTTKNKKYGATSIEVDGGQWYDEVPVGSIQPHPDNPNKGDVEAIQESIRANDFYGACVVQASSGRILAGEHRWRAAKAEGLTLIPVIYRDCDDHTALRVMLVDNETARHGEVDPEVVSTLLDTLETLEGTGFQADWLEQLDQEREQEQEKLVEDEQEKAEADEPPDDSHFGAVFAVIVQVGTEAEQEAAYQALAETYGAENLRLVSV